MTPSHELITADADDRKGAFGDLRAGELDAIGRNFVLQHSPSDASNAKLSRALALPPDNSLT
jgi:hypothetical protein